MYFCIYLSLKFSPLFGPRSWPGSGQGVSLMLRSEGHMVVKP